MSASKPLESSRRIVDLARWREKPIAEIDSDLLIGAPWSRAASPGGRRHDWGHDQLGVFPTASPRPLP